MKSKYFLRYKFLIENLQRYGNNSFINIQAYIVERLEWSGYNEEYLKRTFIRDKKDISELFGINIKYDRQDNSYYIDETDIIEPSKKLLDTFMIINAMQQSNDYKSFISYEKQNFGEQGVFYELTDAIKNRNRIKLYYEKYYEEKLFEYLLEPLALKEFRQRWYLIAVKKPGKELRIFSLDRILKLEIQKARFEKNEFDFDNYFKDYYGIIVNKNAEFTDVILQFNSSDGNYIKSLPLHQSQEIVSETKEKLTIKIKLHITYDFMQKLLSLGTQVKVIFPEFLKKHIIEESQKVINQYI